MDVLGVLLGHLVPIFLAFLSGRLGKFREYPVKVGGLLLLALALSGFVAYNEITGVLERQKETAERQGQEAIAMDRHTKMLRVRPKIAQFLIETDKHRDALYPLCNVPNFKKREEKIENEWRTPVVRMLETELVREAKDEFQRANFLYSENLCGRIQWIKEWLADLTNNLRRISDHLERYIP